MISVLKKIIGNRTKEVGESTLSILLPSPLFNVSDAEEAEAHVPSCFQAQ